jgi:hypothetical protein
MGIIRGPTTPTPSRRTSAATRVGTGAYLHGQVRERLTGYRKIDYIFYVKVEYAQLLNDASEIGFRVIDPAVRAQTTGVGGQPPDTLPLTLPIRRPEVAVPVVELFLSDPQAP